MLPLTAAAARLGVGVFTSGPLSEAGVLRDSGLMVRVCQLACYYAKSRDLVSAAVHC
jgi:hypothetical protein